MWLNIKNLKRGMFLMLYGVSYTERDSRIGFGLRQRP